jgi:hypothetical protein
MPEAAYVEFLERLADLDGICFAVATDSAVNTIEAVAHHRTRQEELIRCNVDRMHHQEGRDSISELADRIAQLPDQLYVQLICQIELIDQVLKSATLYYVQRTPATLANFRWRIDQKNATVTEYESLYMVVLSPFMQSRSISDPMIMLEGADYSHFERFRCAAGEVPTYLRDEYGLDVAGPDGSATNIGQILREDVNFFDSRDEDGIQVADLLASGLRRCLRGQFDDNDLVAAKLGRLMLQERDRAPPIRMVSLGTRDGNVSELQTRRAIIMRDNARAMLVR